MQFESRKINTKWLQQEGGGKAMRHKSFGSSLTCTGLKRSSQQEAPHRISSPFNPHPRVPSQGLSSLALSKKHLSS